MLENFKPSDHPSIEDAKGDPFKIPEIKDLPPFERIDINVKIDNENINPLPPINKFPKLDRELSSPEYGISYCIPQSGGTWEGNPGDSIWYPDRDTKPQRWPKPGDIKEENRKTWEEILDKYKIEGIPFKDGEPDFSEVSIDKVEIDDFTTERRKNFAQADEKLAEQWTNEKKDGKEWTARDVAEWREKNDCTWHECKDMKTMQLVPREVHNNIPHEGGISVAKSKQNESKE